MVELKENKNMIETLAFVVVGFAAVCTAIAGIYYVYAAIDWVISKLMGV